MHRFGINKGEDHISLKECTKNVWLKWNPKKINVFVWRVLLDKIATLPNLKKRGALYVEAETFCRLCEAKMDETPVHLFTKCDFAKSV